MLLLSPWLIHMMHCNLNCHCSVYLNMWVKHAVSRLSWVHIIPAPCVADVVVIVEWMVYGTGVSVITSEPSEDRVKLFVTANDCVEWMMIVFAVVLGPEDSAENNRQIINLVHQVFYVWKGNCVLYFIFYERHLLTICNFKIHLYEWIKANLLSSTIIYTRVWFLEISEGHK